MKAVRHCRSQLPGSEQEGLVIHGRARHLHPQAMASPISCRVGTHLTGTTTQPLPVSLDDECGILGPPTSAPKHFAQTSVNNSRRRGSKIFCIFIHLLLSTTSTRLPGSSYHLLHILSSKSSQWMPAHFPSGSFYFYLYMLWLDREIQEFSWATYGHLPLSSRISSAALTAAAGQLSCSGSTGGEGYIYNSYHLFRAFVGVGCSLQGSWLLSSPTRDPIHALYSGSAES